MFIFRAIIVSAGFTVLAVMGAAFSQLTNEPWADPWVVGPIVFVICSVLGIIKPVSINSIFQYERWGRLRVPPNDSDDADTAEKRISEKS